MEEHSSRHKGLRDRECKVSLNGSSSYMGLGVGPCGKVNDTGPTYFTKKT